MKKQPTVAEVTDALSPVFQRYGIVQAVLFGSHARGEASDRSDVDLILLQRTKKRFLDRYEGIQLDLNLAIQDVPVEALIYTPEEFETMKNRPFLQQALREGRIIYESV